MILWDIMRSAAIIRHRFLNVVFEGGCQVKWEEHMKVVRGFYGY